MKDARLLFTASGEAAQQSAVAIVSPDGARIAWAEPGEGSVVKLFVMNADGGERRPLREFQQTSADGGFSRVDSFAWTDDCAEIAYGLVNFGPSKPHDNCPSVTLGRLSVRDGTDSASVTKPGLGVIHLLGASASDGTFILHGRCLYDENRMLSILAADGGLVRERAVDAPSVSPSHRWLFNGRGGPLPQQRRGWRGFSGIHERNRLELIAWEGFGPFVTWKHTTDAALIAEPVCIQRDDIGMCTLLSSGGLIEMDFETGACRPVLETDVSKSWYLVSLSPDDEMALVAIQAKPPASDRPFTMFRGALYEQVYAVPLSRLAALLTRGDPDSVGVRIGPTELFGLAMGSRLRYVGWLRD